MVQGLLEYKESAEYWRKALATFPSEGLTATEQKQKLNCELELKTALQRATLSDEEKLIVMPPHVKGEMPWYRAKALEARLQAGLPDIATSSVGMIRLFGNHMLNHSFALRHGSYFALPKCVVLLSFDGGICLIILH